MSKTKLAGALIGIAFALTACSDTMTDTGVGKEFNDADVEFAQQMIPHHQQALMMAEMAERAAATDELEALAKRIEEAQQPEIDLMQGWLDEWDEDVTDLGMMNHDMMGHGDDDDGFGMPGMMSGGMLRGMRQADGVAFDLMWLRGMIEHHEGAVEMAQQEQRLGLDEQTIALAERIEADQTEEIAYMRDLIQQIR